MQVKKLTTALVATLGLAVSAFATESVEMRLKWKAGDIYTYGCEIEMNVSAEGQNAKFTTMFDVTLRVLRESNCADVNMAALGNDGHVAPSRGPSFALGGHHLVIAVEHGTLKLCIKFLDKTIDVQATRHEITAFMNGTRMPSDMLAPMRKEFRPLQQILKSPIELIMTDSGHVVKVSGLEKFDPDLQKELAMGFLQGLHLSEKPLNIGDSYKSSRSLTSVFPNYTGKSAEALEGKSITTRYVLKSVEKADGNQELAVLDGTCQQKMEDVPLDPEGTMGFVELNLQDVLVWDVKGGTINLQSTNGTIILCPNASSEPVKIALRMDLKLIPTPRVTEPSSGSATDSERSNSDAQI